MIKTTIETADLDSLAWDIRRNRLEAGDDPRIILPDSLSIHPVGLESETAIQLRLRTAIGLGILTKTFAANPRPIIKGSGSGNIDTAWILSQPRFVPEVDQWNAWADLIESILTITAPDSLAVVPALRTAATGTRLTARELATVRAKVRGEAEAARELLGRRDFEDTFEDLVTLSDFFIPQYINESLYHFHVGETHWGVASRWMALLVYAASQPDADAAFGTWLGILNVRINS